MIFITNSIEVFDLGRIATPIITWASPYILIWAVFSIMFLLMPNTKVRVSSAIFGGIIAGSLFLGLQFAYITFQIGMSKDRKSTRLNSSHVRISYAVFCLKKKKKI